MKVLAMAALFLLQQAQPAQPPANVQQTPKSTIEGFVLRVGTSEPVPRARITISRVSGPAGLQVLPGQMALPQVTTDSQGKFLIKDLEEGSYRLTAQRNGFARQDYGERAPGRGGTVLNVQGGQAMKDVMFRLTPAGAVSGRVSDPIGEPIAGLTVALLRPSYDGAGRRNYQPAGTTRTNDRGEYRFYWVTPGRYYLSAAPGRSDFPGSNFNGNEVIDPGYATTYYPGTTDASLAAAVEVQPGAELSTIDLTMVPQHVFTIRGRVLDGTTGQSPRQASVTIMPRRVTGAFVIGGPGPAYNPGSGTFELRDVVPGSYWVRVMVFPTVPGPTTQPLVNQVPVDVSGSNIENLVVTVSLGFSFPGRVTVDGGGSLSNLSTDNLRVFLQPTAPDVGMFGGQPPRVTAEGTFLIENVSPGDYRVSLNPMPNAYIKSARFGNVDALQDGISISGSVSAALEIVLSTNAAQIDGTVVDKDRKPVSGIQAVLIPDRRDRRDLYKTVTSDQNGRFILRNVAPADYRLFAWEDLEPFAYNDPEILRRYEQQGNPIKTSESAKLTVEAKMIPAGQ